MADITDRTTDVTIFEPDGDKGVAVIDDAGVYRLATDAKVVVDAINVDTDVRTLGQKMSDEDRLFVVNLDGINLGVPAAEQNVLLVKNPSSSGKELRISRLIGNGARSVNSLELRVYRNPTTTSDGTALTERCLNDITETATAETYKLPTVTDRGSLYYILSVPLKETFEFDFDFRLFVKENEELLITVFPLSANDEVSLNLEWGEQST